MLLRLSQPVLTPVTVDYTTQNGTALAGTDYDAVTSSVTFAPGQTVATINVSLLTPDATAEGKTFSILLSQPSLANGGRGTLVTTTATVTLLTSYPAGTPAVALSLTYSSGTSFAEDSGTATVTATLTGGASSTDTLINLTFTGIALFGTDYVTSGESIFIPKGSTTGTITLSGNDVAIAPAGLSVSVGVSAINGVSTSSITPVTAALSPGGVASASISGTVTVPLVNGNVEPLAGVIVYLINGSVTPNNAFNPSINVFTTTDANGNYSFTGLPAGSYTVRELIPSDAYVVTSPSTDLVSVTALTQGEQATPTTIPTLAFKDAFTAIWGAYSATVIDPSNVGVFWTFQSFDDDQSANDFNTWGVQATELAVTNFTADTSQQDAAQSSILVAFSPTPSFLLTPGGSQTVTVSISAAQQTATTIYIGLAGSAIGVAETGFFNEYANYEVETGLNSYFTEGAPLEVIIPAGQTTGSFTLVGANGSTGLPTSLTLSVDQINLAAPAVTEPTVAVTIAAPTISIENAVAVVGSGDANVTVRLSNDLPVATTVDYVTEMDTFHTGTMPATAGTQYTFEDGSISIPANTLIGTISIPMGRAPLPDGGEAETFLVAITGDSVGANLFPVGPPAGTATVYLLNQQPLQNVGPNVTFAIGATTINTTGAADSTTFTATLENANTTSDTIIDLAFAPFNGATTPVLGTDYTVTSETIVIPEGSTTGSITITGNNQNTGEFVVSATKLFGASLGVPTPTTSFDETLTPSLALQGGGGTISGEVVNQNNQPMAGVYVYLGLPVTSALVYQPNDPAYVAGSPFVVTGPDGRYEFTGLSVANPPGDEYSVSELVPANYIETDPTGNYYTVSISFSTTTGVTYATNFVEDGGTSTGAVAGSNFPGLQERAGRAGRPHRRRRPQRRHRGRQQQFHRLRQGQRDHRSNDDPRPVLAARLEPGSRRWRRGRCRRPDERLRAAGRLRLGQRPLVCFRPR